MLTYTVCTVSNIQHPRLHCVIVQLIWQVTKKFKISFNFNNTAANLYAANISLWVIIRGLIKTSSCQVYVEHTYQSANSKHPSMDFNIFRHQIKNYSHYLLLCLHNVTSRDTEMFSAPRLVHPTLKMVVVPHKADVHNMRSYPRYTKFCS